MDKDKKNLEKLYTELNKKLFPKGKDQQREEAEQIKKLSSGKLSFDESLTLLLPTSALFAISEDRSDNSIIGYINKKTEQKLSDQELKNIFHFILTKFHKMFQDYTKTINE